MYLALPVGWSFAVLRDGARTWAAFPPSDQLRGFIDEFVGPRRTARTAEMIKGILDEAFAGIDEAERLSGSLATYMADGAEPPHLRDQLRTIVDAVSGSAADNRLM